MNSEETLIICPIRDILNPIMNTWSMGILLLLHHGKLRFSEIFRALPGDISKRMLSKSLRSLEENGLILRTVYPTKPPSVEYELTQLGKSFLPIVHQLENWANTHQEVISLARQHFIQAKN